MAIDTQRLRALSQLLLGTAFSYDQCDKLVKTLGVTEEVLPWFVLRHGAFKSFPQINESLAAASRKCPYPSSRRAPARVLSKNVIDFNRAYDAALSAVVASNISDEGLSLSAEHLLCCHVQTTKATATFDAQHRILWSPQ